MGTIHIKKRDGRHLNLLVAGARDVVHLPRARAMPTVPRTIVSSTLAERVARGFGRSRWVDAGPFGRLKGPAVKVSIAIDGHTAVDVSALVADLPNGARIVVGADILDRLGPRVSTDP